MFSRRVAGLVIPVLGAVLAVVSVPGIAAAGGVLTPGQVVTSATPDQFAITTIAHPYWSVIGVVPPFGQDYDLIVTRNGSTVSGSSLGSSVIDFVAIDGNRLASTTYGVSVNRFGGSNGAYSVAFADPGRVMSIGGTDSAPMTGGEFVRVFDVYLTAGVTYGLISGHAGDGFLMASNPADS